MHVLCMRVCVHARVCVRVCEVRVKNEGRECQNLCQQWRAPTSACRWRAHHQGGWRQRAGGRHRRATLQLQHITLAEARVERERQLLRGPVHTWGGHTWRRAGVRAAGQVCSGGGMCLQTGQGRRAPEVNARQGRKRAAAPSRQGWRARVCGRGIGCMGG